MVKRGKLGKERGIKGKTLKGSISKGFSKVIKCSKGKKVIVGAVFVSVLSLSCIGYFQGKSALATNSGDYKSLEISKSAEKINSITAYDKIKKGEEINVLLLGDESYLGNVILKEDLVSFIESNYNSKVNITDLSIDNANVYDQLNRYIDIDVNDRNFDLVFLCFDNEDEQDISQTNFGGIYEAIIRDLRYNNTSVDIMPVIKHKTLVNDTYYQIINVLSKYYELEMSKVNEDVISKGVEGESIEDFRENYTTVLTGIIKNNIDNSRTINTDYKEMYYGVTTLLEPYKINVKGEKKKGFSISQYEAKSSNKNDYIKYKVEGNIIGLGYETKKDGGIIEIYVNRILYKRIDTNSENEETKYILISSNLTGLNEIKIINGNGGEVSLLGVITSGDNTDSKEVENFNNILARNTGNYSVKSKNDSLYEGAKVESSEVKNSEKSLEEEPSKKSESTESKVQSKPSISVSKPSSNASSSNNSKIESNEEIKKSEEEESKDNGLSKPNSSTGSNVNNNGTSTNGGANNTNNWGGNNNSNSGENNAINNNVNNNVNNSGGNEGGNNGNNINNSTNNNEGGNSGNNVNNSTNNGGGDSGNNGNDNVNNSVNSGVNNSQNNSVNNNTGSSGNGGGNNTSNGNSTGNNNISKPIEPTPTPPVESVTPSDAETPAE